MNLRYIERNTPSCGKKNGHLNKIGKGAQVALEKGVCLSDKVDEKAKRVFEQPKKTLAKNQQKMIKKIVSQKGKWQNI